MKLSEYIPASSILSKAEQEIGSLANTLSLMKSGAEDRYKSPSLGIDYIVNTWMRQQMAYRRQLVINVIQIADSVSEIRSTVHHITSEVFRRGIQWKPKFATKCLECGVEQQDVEEQCSSCKSTKLIRPREKQKTRFDEFLTDCNLWDQSLEDVLRQMHHYVNICDDAFLYIAKEYIKVPNSDEVRSRPIEIRCINPALIEYDIDKNGLPKNAHWVCYIHRDYSPRETPGICTVKDCNLNLIPAMFRYNQTGAAITNYWLDSEVIHIKKFSQNELYGWSPVLTIFEKAMTLLGMDKNLYDYFLNRQMPASMVMVFTDDPESLRAERAHMAAEMRRDRNYIPLIAVATKQNRGRVDMVRLFHTLQEMEYLPVRQEIRERISAMWGVTPIWQSSVDSLGGISSQSQQLKVMSRVVEGDQRLFQQKVFPFLLESFGVTDWELELPQPEEIAEQTRLQFTQQKISAANMLVQMGFTVEIKSDKVGIEDINFVISGKAKNPMEAMGQPGGFGSGIPGAEEPSLEGEFPPPPGQESSSTLGLGLMEKAQDWIRQINERGYEIRQTLETNPEGPEIKFRSQFGVNRAIFSNGKLIHIEKVSNTPRPMIESFGEDNEDETDAEETE